MGRILSVARVVLAGLVLSLAGKPVKVLAVCAGDCDGSGDVSLDEITALVEVALGSPPLTACADGISSGTPVDIALIIQAVDTSLNSCPAPVSTPTPMPTVISPPGISTQMLGTWSGHAVNQSTGVDKPARIKIEVVGGAAVITDLGGNVFLHGTKLTATILPTPTTLLVTNFVGSFPNGYAETLTLGIAPNGQLAGPYGNTTISISPVVTAVGLVLDKEP